jgi:hypothetical protein
MKRSILALAASACLLFSAPARASGMPVDGWTLVFLFPFVLIGQLIDSIGGDDCGEDCYSTCETDCDDAPQQPASAPQQPETGGG